MTKFKAMVVNILVTPKVAAKCELLFNKPSSEAGLLNKILRFAVALVVTKFIMVISLNLFTLCCAA